MQFFHNSDKDKRNPESPPDGVVHGDVEGAGMGLCAFWMAGVVKVPEIPVELSGSVRFGIVHCKGFYTHQVAPHVPACPIPLFVRKKKIIFRARKT